MAVDGSWRRQLTDDTYYNTDPSLSPDGRYVAISSYRGEDRPKPGTNERLEQHAWDWQLVVRDLQTNTERVLTKGLKECLHRFRDPCDPSEAVAWAPQWSPDGRRIGYLSIRGPESGLFVIDADGSNARALVTSKTRTVTYWDWVVAGDPPSGAVEAIGSKLSNSRMLYGARVFDFEIGPGMKPPPVKLFSATDDRFATQELKLSRSDLVPQNARWTPNRKGVVFAARVPIDRSKETPEPEPPDGASRNIHFSFSELDTVLSTLDLPRPSEDVGELQLFLMDTGSGKVHQLTTPWTEDYLDAIPDGEARGNTDPDMSPDGRYVVFTNLGGSSFESWVLRRDLASGEVINLTNMTAGAIPTADSKPRFSPDGSRIAFMSATVNTTQVYVMDRDGLNVRQVTDDDYVNLDPTWSPDGRWLAYSSYRGDDLIAELEDEAAITTRQIPMDDWYLVKVDVETGIQEVLTRPTDSPVFRPVWSPDGERIAFISSGRSPQPDVFVVNADGTNVRELQITLLSKEEFLDWR
jgi:Tol biopolymer transport system component